MEDSIFPQWQRFVLALEERGLVAMQLGKPLLLDDYVRSSESEPAYADACTQELDRRGDGGQLEARRGLLRGRRGRSQLTRPSPSGLLDALRLPDAVMAVLVEERHLSRKAEASSRCKLPSGRPASACAPSPTNSNLRYYGPHPPRSEQAAPGNP